MKQILNINYIVKHVIVNYKKPLDSSIQYLLSKKKFNSLINQLVTSSSQVITKGTINELRDQLNKYVNVQIPD